METIAQELSRYSLAGDEEGVVKAPKVTRGTASLQSHEGMQPGESKPRNVSLEKQALKSVMNFPALSIASASAWSKRRPPTQALAAVEDEVHTKDVARFMNTYRLEPKRPFNVEAVQAVLRETLTRDLSHAHYEPNNMSKLCVSLAGDIRNKVKQLNYDRYRIVCLVQIVECHHQSLLSSARFLWDADRDRYASFSLANPHLAAMACVFGIYYE